MKRKKKNNLNKIIKLLIISIIIVLIFSLYSLYKDDINNNTYNIILKNGNELNIYEGESYIEFGYDVYDKDGNLVNKECTIEGTVDSNTPGTYEINYIIKGNFNINKVTRIVNILENPLKWLTFDLKESSNINVNLNEDYIEYGVTCINNNSDCSNLVKIVNNVSTNKLGTYTVTYSLTIGNKTKTLTRNVNVIGDNYSYTISNTNLTNQSINITFNSNLNLNDFNYIILPNSNPIYTDSCLYTVDTNGTYNFAIIKKDGSRIDASINITNIDKVAPTGTCSGRILNNNTYLTFTGNDSSGIMKYSIFNKDYTSTSITVNSNLENANLTIYDNAGNSSQVVCDLYYDQITVNGTSKVNYSSDTLKYNVITVNDYYVAFIWVRDPANQFKMGLGGKPTGLKYVKDIVDGEVSSKKGYIAVNASFFTSSNFEPSYNSNISGWRDTSTIPVLYYNGKLIRDYTNLTINNTRYAVAFTKSLSFKMYKFKTGKDNISYNQELAKEMKEDGVYFSFAPSHAIVRDGVAKDSGTERAGRTGVCQINKNNYLLLSSSGTGSIGQMASIMASYNCKNGYNLDGGGSRTMVYKKGKSSSTVLTGNSRKVADALYFVEK